jgi:ketosteroid isomerase-like protein
MRTLSLVARVVSLLTIAACARGSAAPASDSTGSTAASATTSAPATGSVDTASIRKAIEDADAKWAANSQANNVSGIMTNYAPNAVVTYEGHPMAAGTDAIARDLAQDTVGRHYTDVKYHTVNLITDGNLAIEMGTAHTVRTVKSGKSVTNDGRYMTVWQKQADGSWKVVRDADVARADTTKH